MLMLFDFTIPVAKIRNIIKIGENRTITSGKKISVGVYGGSITKAQNVPTGSSYSDLLAQRFPHMHITNLGK